MKILSLDIGETTGVAYWDYDKPFVLLNQDMLEYLLHKDEAKTEDLEAKIREIITRLGNPDIIVIEKFALYAHRASSKIGSSFIEVENIGRVKTLAKDLDLPVIEQMAVNAKTHFTDKKLKEHNVYFKGSDHIRDAIRHGLHFICFSMKHYLKGGKYEHKSNII